MKINKKNIQLDKLLTPVNFGKLKNTTRQMVYLLIDNDEIDWVEIDGVKFIYLSEKSLNYQKSRYL